MADPVDFSSQPLGLSQQNPQLLALLSALLANQTKTTGTATLTGADGKPISKNAQQVPSLLAQLLTGGPDQIGGITGNYTPGQYGLGGAGSGPVSDSSARGGGIKFSDGGVLMNQYSTPIGWNGEPIKEAGGKGAVTTGDFTTALNDYLGALSKQNAPQTAGPLTGTPAPAPVTPAAPVIPSAMAFQPPVSQPAPTPPSMSSNIAPNLNYALNNGTLTPQQVIAAGGGQAGLTASAAPGPVPSIAPANIPSVPVQVPVFTGQNQGAAATPSLGSNVGASQSASKASSFPGPSLSPYLMDYTGRKNSNFSLNSMQPNDMSSLGTNAYQGGGAVVGDIGAGMGGPTSIGTLAANPAADASFGNLSGGYSGGGGATVGSSMGGVSPQLGSAIASGISGVGSGLSQMAKPVQVGIPQIPQAPRYPVFTPPQLTPQYT